MSEIWKTKQEGHGLETNTALMCYASVEPNPKKAAKTKQHILIK